MLSFEAIVQVNGSGIGGCGEKKKKSVPVRGGSDFQ